MSENLDNFEIAFSTGGAGSFRECACGAVFYNSSGDWDWEYGELEKLQNSDATDLDYSCGEVEFEGVVYCNACFCWHKRAKKIIEFIRSHDYAIAKFLKYEKERKEKEAKNSPTVDLI